MKANHKLLPTSLAALGLSVFFGILPANAADVIMEEPPAPAAPMEEPPLNTWSGPYAGVSIGYGFGGETNGAIGGDIETDGFIGGAFVGYNAQMDSVVFGAEADLNYAGLRGENAATESRSGVDGSLRARLGYAVTDDILIYGTAGGAGQSLELTEGGVSDRNTMLGWTAGGGADMKFTENMFGRVEYRYSDFGSENFTTGGGTASVDSRDHRVTFGVGMKF